MGTARASASLADEGEVGPGRGADRL